MTEIDRAIDRNIELHKRELDRTRALTEVWACYMRRATAAAAANTRESTWVARTWFDAALVLAEAIDSESKPLERATRASIRSLGVR